MPGSLELGLFLPSTSGSLIIAEGTPPQSKPTWKLNRDVTVAAENAGFDFALSQVKWRGYGGASGHWDAALESFTLMAGLAAVTTRLQLYASVAIRTMNPAVLAKMAATVDEISGGRFGVNIVAGWNKLEYSQMNMWSDDEYYINRYEYADEYLTILKLLWSQDRVDFKGKYLSVEDCTSWPKPGRRLPIVCAGQSDGALAFVAREADYAFVGRMNDTAEQLGTLARRIAAMGAAHQRDVGAYTLLTVIAEPTREAAEARKQAFLDARDHVAIKEWMRVCGMDANRADYASLDPTTATFMSVPYIVASYAEVAAHLDRLGAAGVRGVCLAFPDFANDVPRFIEDVMPLMISRKAA